MPTKAPFERYGQMRDGKAQGMDAFASGAQLPGGPGAAARARRLIERELRGRLPQQMLEDVELLVTELVANVVRHGGGDPGSSLQVLLEGRRPGLRVEVVNAERGTSVPARRAPDLEGGGGLGLNLLETMASRWGIRSWPRTAVWFEVDC